MRVILLGFAFGHRGKEPGLSNKALAESILKHLAATNSDVIVSVQWEIGTVLRKLGIEPNHEVRKHLLKKGVYLSTEEVARQMADFLKQWTDVPHLAFAFAQDDHMSRVLNTLRKYGIKAKPGCKNIPYDPESHQIWTRSPLFSKSKEFLLWPIYKYFGQV